MKKDNVESTNKYLAPVEEKSIMLSEAAHEKRPFPPIDETSLKKQPP